MDSLKNIAIQSGTMQRGRVQDFVARFAELWADPAANVEAFAELLSPNVRLIAPMGPTTVGHAAATRSFRRIFAVMPDLRATVRRWSATSDSVFIEMQFTATIGGREVSWWNVDRFVFDDGLAIERVAYFDPSVVRRAFLRRPRGWIQLAKLVRPLR